MDDEQDLIAAFEKAIHEDFPNPRRLGCPDHESLVKLVSQAASPKLSGVIAHIRQCAPCFDELKKLRAK